MQHSFDISIATKFGVNEAIFLNNIAFWIAKNKANNKHFHEGRYWTYNSSKALAELFPYWSDDQIDRLIKKCCKLDLLLINNFNDTSYDRTRWFGLTDFALELFNLAIPRNHGMDTTKSRTPFREIAEPIPDINTDNKPNKRERKKRAPLSPFMPDKENTMLCQTFNLDLHEETLSFRERHKGVKTQYEFSRWLKNAKEYQDRKKNVRNTDRNEVKSSIPDYGPGHPRWEALHGTNALFKDESNAKQDRSQNRSFDTKISGSNIRGNGVRKATEYLF